MDPNDYDFLEDPYEWLIEMNNQMYELTQNHNKLVNDYTATLKRLKFCEKQLIELQQQLIFLTNQ